MLLAISGGNCASTAKVPETAADSAATNDSFFSSSGLRGAGAGAGAGAGLAGLDTKATLDIKDDHPASTRKLAIDPAHQKTSVKYKRRKVRQEGQGCFWRWTDDYYCVEAQHGQVPLEDFPDVIRAEDIDAGDCIKDGCGNGCGRNDKIDIKATDENDPSEYHDSFGCWYQSFGGDNCQGSTGWRVGTFMEHNGYKFKVFECI